MPTIFDTKLHATSLVTIALPYSNGSLHLGHAVEATIGCCFATHRRLSGQSVTFICADDVHGTATERLADSLGQPVERVVGDIGREHRADYANLRITFDDYGSTNSETNRILTLEILQGLKDNGHVERRETTQLYDEQVGLFLDDRRVYGSCPSCSASDQHGDGCEVCGATFDAVSLVDPVSRITGSRPVLRKAEHLFFKLENMREDIEKWLIRADITKQTKAKLREWLNGDLRDWCLTRKGPYFGFAVPDEADLFLYVWVDAPVAYFATAYDYWMATGETSSWRDAISSSDREVIHIIGKDIANHHGIFWIALLAANGIALPDRIHTHGFATVAGEKMSKSRGNFVRLKDALKEINADSLRYLIASNVAPGIADFDLNGDMLRSRVDGELVGKIANLAVRLGPIAERIGSHLSKDLPEPAAEAERQEKAKDIVSAYEAMDLRAVTRGIVELADKANRDLTEAAPWKAEDEYARNAMTDALLAFRTIMVLLQPITPDYARKGLAIFGEENVPWRKLGDAPLGQTFLLPKRLMERISNTGVAVLSQKTN